MFGLYAQCSCLRAAIKTLTGEMGRAVTVTVIDGPNRSLPEGWDTWEPWLLDSPNPFLASLVENSTELGNVVEYLGSVRAQIKSVRCEALRTEFSMVFDLLLKWPWLLRIDPGFYGYGSSNGDDEPPSFCQEWILRVPPTPVAYWDELVQMSKEIVLHQPPGEQPNRSTEMSELRPPKKAGATRLVDRNDNWPLAIAMIFDLKENGKSQKDIATEVGAKYPKLGRFTEKRIEGILRREKERRQL